jgi:hypothetical protein
MHRIPLSTVQLFYNLDLKTIIIIIVAITHKPKTLSRKGKCSMI